MKLIKYIQYIPLIVILFLSQVEAQDARFDSLVDSGIKQIYNIKFPEAEQTFRNLISDYPDHPAGRFFLAMIEWWKILLNLDSEEHDEIFFQKLEDVIFQCDNLLDKNPENVDALFFKGGAIGFRGRLRANRNSWLKAADDGRDALPIVERAANLNPDNVDVQLGFGIYNYYAEVIPDEYPIIKPLMLFFPSGDKKKGIEQLNNTAHNGKYAKYEAQYFLMTLYFNYENNPYKAEEYAEMLTKEFPDNPVFQRWKGRIAAKKGDYFTAASVFNSVLDKMKLGYPGYDVHKVIREATYYVGYQYFNTNKLDSAAYYFRECARVSRETDKEEASGFQANAVLYIGMINDLWGNRDAAISSYKKVLDMDEYANSHKQAERYIEKPFKK
jgi:tetratricopeptide (TPR) repeat protein